MPLRLTLIGLLSGLAVALCGPAAPADPPAAGGGPAPLQPIDPAHTALLVLDMQQGILALAGPGADPLTARIAAAERASRAAGVTVGFIKTEFSPGYPEVSRNNKAFAPVIGSGRMLRGSPETRLDPRIAPVGAEPVLVKHRIGAFSADALDRELRARHITTLVLTGIATSGVVLSTVRAAADLDYRVIVLSDCVTDRDPELNKVLLDKVFPVQADVIDTGRYDAALGR